MIAIVSPDKFGVWKPENGRITKEGRRILILISKIIQNIANGITQFKELSMQVYLYCVVSVVFIISNQIFF